MATANVLRTSGTSQPITSVFPVQALATGVTIANLASTAPPIKSTWTSLDSASVPNNLLTNWGTELAFVARTGRRGTRRTKAV